jgi:hypothetical protein
MVPQAEEEKKRHADLKFRHADLKFRHADLKFRRADLTICHADLLNPPHGFTKSTMRIY